MLAEHIEPVLLKSEELLLMVDTARPMFEMFLVLMRFNSVVMFTAAEGRTLTLVLSVEEAPKASVTVTYTYTVRFDASNPVGRKLVVIFEEDVIPRGSVAVVFDKA